MIVSQVIPSGPAKAKLLAEAQPSSPKRQSSAPDGAAT